ncbi:hypothetical protein TNCV_2091371 [Trichonephila clavipes]|nr:hypothetical protein TNCV_2091371 [Trichonephila clavipes]
MLFLFLKTPQKKIETDFDDENEMNNAAPVPTSSEIRNIMTAILDSIPTTVNAARHDLIAPSSAWRNYPRYQISSKMGFALNNSLTI